jgi:acylphosphatase
MMQHTDNEEKRQGIHCIVSGRVQGVFFRNFTQSQATKLGLSGWVKNLASGQVELRAFGSHAALMQLQQVLRSGPPMAKVEHIDSQSIPVEDWDVFSIAHE